MSVHVRPGGWLGDTYNTHTRGNTKKVAYSLYAVLLYLKVDK